eukprot:3000219-Prymnesium_polylepis.1
MEAWGVLSVLYYFEEYLRVYRGRGLPALYDADIASRSQWKGKQGGAPRALLMASIEEPKGQDASTRDDSSKAQSDQMPELLKAQAQIASSVSSMTGQVSKLQSEVAAVKAAQAQAGPTGSGPFVPFMKRACHHCGEPGHYGARSGAARRDPGLRNGRSSRRRRIVGELEDESEDASSLDGFVRPCIEGRHPCSSAVDLERNMKGPTVQWRHLLVEALREAIWEMQRDFASMGMPDRSVQGDSIDVRPIKCDGGQCSEPKSDGEEPERFEL